MTFISEYRIDADNISVLTMRTSHGSIVLIPDAMLSLSQILLPGNIKSSEPTSLPAC